MGKASGGTGRNGGGAGATAKQAAETIAAINSGSLSRGAVAERLSEWNAERSRLREITKRLYGGRWFGLNALTYGRLTSQARLARYILSQTR